MKFISILLVLATTVGCAGAMRGPDTCADIHFDTTYVLARWAGWSPRESLCISAANFCLLDHRGGRDLRLPGRRPAAGGRGPARSPLVKN